MQHKSPWIKLFAECININVHDKTAVCYISFFLRQATDQYSGRGSPVIKNHLKMHMT